MIVGGGGGGGEVSLAHINLAAFRDERLNSVYFIYQQHRANYVTHCKTAPIAKYSWIPSTATV